MFIYMSAFVKQFRSLVQKAWWKRRSTEYGVRSHGVTEYGVKTEYGVRSTESLLKCVSRLGGDF